MKINLTGKRRALVLVPATALVLLLSGQAWAGVSASDSNTAAETAPPGGKVTVDVVTVNGSGCPAGTAEVSVNPDNTAFRVTYNKYSVQDGGNADATDARKNCQLSLRLRAPSGYTFAIAKAVYSGHARLYKGATGLQRANYYFQGSSENNYVDHALTGPLNEDFRHTDITGLVFQPCGKSRNLNINTELRVDSGTADPSRANVISMETSGERISTLYHFTWNKC